MDIDLSKLTPEELADLTQKAKEEADRRESERIDQLVGDLASASDEDIRKAISRLESILMKRKQERDKAVFHEFAASQVVKVERADGRKFN